MKLKTNDSRIAVPLEYARRYFASDDFIKDINSIHKFDHANVSPAQIAELFASFSAMNREVEVKVTYFGFFFKNVLGRTVGNGHAYVNSSGLGRQIWKLGATIVHEVSHVVDEYFPKASFGHGSNSSRGKKNTFSYFIDQKAEAWIMREVLKDEIKKLSMKIALNREVLVG